jgi:hypothetical protein
MLRAAASMSVAFMSLIFSFAMPRISSQVSLPTLVLFGSLEPAPGFFEVGRPHAFFTSTLAGGLFITKEYERSAYTVMTTGRIVSPSGALRALKSLQNCMMFTPCWPRAGPTGGDGFALPAGSWSLM